MIDRLLDWLCDRINMRLDFSGDLYDYGAGDW
jgi:hypothetical protein